MLKLPVVFAHFEEHQAEDPQITLLEFLDIHYMHGSPIDDDYARDMQLPFKSSADCVAVISIAYIPMMETISINSPVLTLAKEIFAKTENALFSSYLSNIWQPPKYC